ncbi:F-actin-monooxygenase mical2b-like isoform X3 [Lepisosteus oculatus]|uniref:F-actin-monooxygenase mical2b-like isoform X3 n=1 Tax=Lepisosteus oculatus TaxID=7918 RepID=UPI0035F52853
MGENDDEKNTQAGQLFENFVQASTGKGTIQAFNILCRQLELDPLDFKSFYAKLKSKVTTWKAKALWNKLDKRASHKEYKKGNACTGTKCLIIGGGPCGLRTAIELALLGAKVVVIEKRDTFSRNNVLHLWPYTIHDLRGLGAKKFYGKFCAGAIDHISIRQLQLMLLKVALLLAVEIHVNVEFVKLLEPPEEQENEGPGWRAEIRPADHPVADFDFDVIVGADGRRNTLEGFRRKEFRGKLAIAITANFINRNTTAEAKVEEISGVAFIFNQKFFQDLKEETGVDLENIVYYKDDTHYFVMTAKKQSLLDKEVIIHDYIDTEKLLSSNNVNQEALLSYAREAADFGTNYQLPSLDYAINHYGQPDVAMFDFTCMYASENAALVRERFGHQLLVALVGDSLLEPFWPMGTGCARGFLAAFDTAWMVKSWAEGKAPLEMLAERESVYRLLPQTTPENITKNFEQYTIDPATRYPNLNSNCVRPLQVRHLYITGELQPCTLERAASVRRSVNLSRHESEIRPNRLLTWCQKQTEGYRNVIVSDLTTSWKSGLALCALIHSFRADLVDFDSLNEEDSARNNQLAFDIAEQEFGIPPVTTGKEMAADRGPDKLSMVMYLSKFYELFQGSPVQPPGIRRKIKENNEQCPSKPANSVYSNLITQTLPRKRIPKVDKKLEDSDYTSKRRRRGCNHLEEVCLKHATNLSSQSLCSVSEGGEGKVGGNQNKVKSMANQLIAKFEENAPSCTLRRQVESGSSAIKPPKPPYLDMIENPRFAKPMDQTPVPPQKRQLQSSASIQYVVERTEQPLQSTGYALPRKPKQADKALVEAESTDCSASCRSTVLAVSGMLQRLQRVEEKVKQRKAQSQSAREFHKKSVKEKAAHLCSLFGYMAFQPQSALPAPSLLPSRPKNSLASPSPESSAASPFSSQTSAPSSQRPPQDLDKLLYRTGEPSEQPKRRNVNNGNGTSCVIFQNPIFEKPESKQTQTLSSSGQMTVGKVSSVIGAMAEVLVTLYENDHRPKACCTSPVLGSMRKEFPQNLGGSDTCHFCKKRVYVMERLSTEGRFFHRECFRCDVCNTTLRLGAYAFDVDEGKFYCKPHFTQRKTSVKHRKRRVDLEKDEKEVVKQEDSGASAQEAASTYSAMGSLESRPPGGCFQRLSNSASPKKSRSVVKGLTSQSCPALSESSSVTGVPEEALHNRIMTDSSYASIESSPHWSACKNEEVPDASDSPRTSVEFQPHLRRSQEYSSAVQPSSSFNRNSRWRRKIQATLPLTMVKKKLIQHPEDTSPTPKDSGKEEESKSESLLGCAKRHIPSSGITDVKTNSSPLSLRSTDRGKVGAGGWGGPSSAYVDQEMMTTKKKLTLSNSQKAKLLDWNLNFSEDLRQQKGAREDKSSWTGKADSPSAINVPVAAAPKPRAQPPQSSKEANKTPQSGLQLLANALRRSFRRSGGASSSGITSNTESSPPRPQPVSDGSFFNFAALFGGPSCDEQLSEPTLETDKRESTQGRIEDTAPPHSASAVSASARCSSELVQLLNNTGNMGKEGLGPQGVENDMPKLLEKVSLNEMSSRATKDDLTILPRRRLNFFSSLRLKRSEGTERGGEGADEVGGRNDIWAILAKFKKKDSDNLSEGHQADHYEASSSSEEEKLSSKQKVSSSHLGSSSPRQRRKQEKMEQRQARHENLKRLHRAQVIQRQLEEVEERQRVLEERGVKLEKELRGETDSSSADETQLLQTWFKLVLEKNKLVRYESELMIFAQELELEDCQSQLQQKLRRRMAIHDSKKSPQELAEEQQVLGEMMRMVEERDRLVVLLEEQRLQERAEDKDLESFVLSKGYQLNWM